MLSLYTPVAGICWDQRLSILPPQLLPLSPVPERLSLTYAALMAELQEAARMGMHSVELTPATLGPVLPEGEEKEEVVEGEEGDEKRNAHLAELPEGLRALAGEVRELAVRSTRLAVVPVWVGELTRLEAIEVSGVENERNTLLKSLPASLGQLGSLKQLTLVRLDGLEVLPDAVVRLTVLGSLTIESSGKCAAEGTRQAGCAQAAHAWGVV